MSIQKKPSPDIKDKNVADWLDYIWTAFQGVFTFYKNVVFKGYTQLGDAGPKIKMKKFTGTTAGAEDGNTTITTGIDSTKIVGFTALVTHTSTSDFLGPEYTRNNGYQYTIIFNTGTFTIALHPTNSENILSKPFIVTVFYEE